MEVTAGETQWTISIPLPPFSMNSLYTILFHQRKVELRREARLWKTLAKQSMPLIQVAPKTLLAVGPITWFAPWLTASGSPRRMDIANSLKLLLDALSEKLGVDDSYFWSVGPLIKVHRMDAPRVELVVRRMG